MVDALRQAGFKVQACKPSECQVSEDNITRSPILRAIPKAESSKLLHHRSLEAVCS
jgi:hypothetical protein